MGNRDLSVFMSLVLRHEPSAANVTLDEHGWANVDDLIAGINATGRSIDLETLREIVDTDPKQRYSLSEDDTLIRANQGHSVQVDLELEATDPPDVLYHGTASRFLDSILSDGLLPMQRRYVHLSDDEGTAKDVGTRHGRPVILEVDAKAMREDGIEFYLSANGVWLVGRVEPRYIRVSGEEG